MNLNTRGLSSRWPETPNHYLLDSSLEIDIFAWLKQALTYMHQADTLQKMEALLPFNVKPENLEVARAIPELIYPEKSVAN